MLEPLDKNNRFGVTLDLDPTVYSIQTRRDMSWKYQTVCYWVINYLIQNGVEFEETPGINFIAPFKWKVSQLADLIDEFYQATGGICTQFPV